MPSSMNTNAHTKEILMSFFMASRTQPSDVVRVIITAKGYWYEVVRSNSGTDDTTSTPALLDKENLSRDRIVVHGTIIP